MAAAAVSKARPKRRQLLPPRALVPFAVAFLVLAATVAYSRLRPPHGTPPPAPGQRGSLVWGDGLFATSAELKAWLGHRGASYRRWARMHPAAAKLVAPAGPRHRRAPAPAHRR